MNSALGSSLLLILALALAVFHVCSASQPNILFVYTDDQAAWAFGGSGNAQAHTPHMDRLAAEGMKFTNAFVVTPVCSPARAQLLTGRHGSELGILDFIPHTGHAEHQPGRITGLDSSLPVFPRLLAEQGYRTALVGKFHLGEWTTDPDRKFHPTRFGYQHFMGLTGGGTPPRDALLEKDGKTQVFKGLVDDVLTEEAIDFLEAGGEGPFLMSLHYRAPHHAWLPVAPEDMAPYQKMDMTLPDPTFPGLDVPRAKKMMREYLAATTGMDRQLGRVLKALDRLDLTRNTVVIFTSDHGYNLGHNGIWHKGNGLWLTKELPPATTHINQRYRPNLYDQSLRVPMIVRWPGVVQVGTTSDRVVSNLDWFPTLLELGGTAAPVGTPHHGRSLVPLFKGENPAAWCNDLYLEYSMIRYGRAYLRGYRTPQWKLIRDLKNPLRDEIYHLEKDPAENQNLIASTRPDVNAARKELHAHLIRRMREINDPLLDYGMGLFPETPNSAMKH